MPAVDVGAIVVKLKAGEADLLKYSNALKDLDNKMKRVTAEFQLINQSLWQGHDHIKDLEKELAAAKETFKKMVANKITPIRKELTDIGLVAANTATMAKTLETNTQALHKGIGTAMGDPGKKKATEEQAKKLENSANNVYVQLNGMKQEIAGLAKTPTV